MKAYQVIARTLGALRRCEQTPDSHADWIKRHSDHLDDLVSEFPSGSGFDNGTKLDDDSTPEKLVFNTAFHHMNENGCYNGWTEHQVIVSPSLELEYTIRITGRDRNEIKDYIADCFHACLDADIEEHAPVAETAPIS